MYHVPALFAILTQAGVDEEVATRIVDFVDRDSSPGHSSDDLAGLLLHWRKSLATVRLRAARQMATALLAQSSSNVTKRERQALEAAETALEAQGVILDSEDQLKLFEPA